MLSGLIFSRTQSSTSCGSSSKYSERIASKTERKNGVWPKKSCENSTERKRNIIQNKREKRESDKEE